MASPSSWSSPPGRRRSAMPCWTHPSPWRPGCSTTTPTATTRSPRLRRPRARGQPHPGQHRRRHHAVLADGHRRLGRPLVLGVRTGPGRSRCGRPGSAAGRGAGRLHELPRRGLPCPAQLGRGGFPRPRLLQRARQRRPLRRLGGARALLDRGAGGVPLAALAKEEVMSTAVDTTTDIRTFRIDIADEQIDDLRRRIAATRWPRKELVEDRSQGVQLATIQELARYWAEENDFGKIDRYARSRW